MNKDCTKFFVGFVMFTVCLVSAGRVQAATLNVCKSGCTYSTIQAAINNANFGDTVLVDDGIYTENINFNGKAITVESVNGSTNTSLKRNQDTEYQDSLVTFNSGEGADSVLKGFTISNNNSWFSWKGGAILCESSSPTITNCTISDNTSQNGGGFYCFNSSPTITNCIISNNVANGGSGGGFYFYGNSSPIITNCIINNNTGGSGGGFYCVDSSLTITNSTINSNKAYHENGGGIYCNTSSSATISNGTISNNSADKDGGGIFCADSSLSIKNCIISSNIAGEFGVGNGGGIWVYNSSSIITNCVISRNRANQRGGGIYCRLSSPMITNSTITRNFGIRLSDWIKGCGIYCFDSSPTVINSIFWNNFGSEVYLSTGGSITILYSNIMGGDPDNPGQPYLGPGNIGEDLLLHNPLFVDEVNGDYHLTENSPCIDRGKSAGAPDFDIDGNTRPYDVPNIPNNPSAYDMGADEYVNGGSADGDVNGDGNITPQDALMVFQHYLGFVQLDASQQTHGDVNQDGSITPADALCIFQKYLGLPSCIN